MMAASWDGGIVVLDRDCTEPCQQLERLFQIQGLFVYCAIPVIIQFRKPNPGV